MKTVQRFINRREGNHSNWAAHSVGDHDKTWKLQTHAHTLKHIPHGQEPGGNPGALRVLARASSPHTFTHALVAHQRQPRPLSHPAGLLPTSQPALWPSRHQDTPPPPPSQVVAVSLPLARNHRAWRWDQSPPAPHCHSRTILLPSPTTLRSSGFQTRPRVTPPPTTPRQPGHELFAGLRMLSFFSKTTPVRILGDFNTLTANLPGWRPLSSTAPSLQCPLLSPPSSAPQAVGPCQLHVTPLCSRPTIPLSQLTLRPHNHLPAHLPSRPPRPVILTQPGPMTRVPPTFSLSFPCSSYSSSAMFHSNHYSHSLTTSNDL